MFFFQFGHFFFSEKPAWGLPGRTLANVRDCSQFAGSGRWRRHGTAVPPNTSAASSAAAASDSEERGDWRLFVPHL